MFNDRKLPKDITIKNTSNEPISFRFYGVNIVKTLEPDEEIVITGASSEVTSFYLTQMDDVKGLSVEAYVPDEPEPHPQPEPGVTHTVTLTFTDGDGNTLLCNPTLDDKSGEEDAEGCYIWYDVEEGMHTVRVDYVGYEVFQDDINVLDDYSISYILTRDEEPTEDTYTVSIEFKVDGYEENNVECDVTLDDVAGSPDEYLCYHWYDITNGVHTVSVNKDGYESYSSSVTVEGADYNATWFLTPSEEPVEDTYSITVRFLDKNTHNVLDCDVLLSGNDGTYSGECDIDTLTYNWYDLPAGEYIISASHEDYEDFSTTIEVGNGFGDYNGDFYMTPLDVEYTYTVHIGFHPEGTSDVLMCEPTLDGVIGDFDGDSYLWDNITPGFHTVQVQYGGYEPLAVEIEVLEEDFYGNFGLTPIEPIENTYHISARFLDSESGLPLDCNASIEGGYGTSSFDEDTHTFYWTDLQAGEYTINAYYDGFEDFTVGVAVGPEYGNTETEFYMTPLGGDEPEEYYDVYLTFVDASTNEPITDLEIVAINGNDGYTIANNRYEWHNVTPGEYDLWVKDSRYEELNENITVDDNFISTIELTPVEPEPPEGYTLTVAVYNELDGVEVSNLSYVRLNNMTYSYVTPEGYYVWENLMVGEYNLEIYDNRFNDINDEIYMDTDKRIDYTAYYKTVDSVTVHLSNDAGESVYPNSVTIEEVANGYEYTGVLNGQDDYEFYNVYEGTYLLKYSDVTGIQNYEDANITITVNENECQFDIVLPSAEPEPEPEETYTVSIRFDDDMGNLVHPEATLDGISGNLDGNDEYYVWEGVTTGTHTLVAMLSGYYEIFQDMLIESDYRGTCNFSPEEPEPVDYTVTFVDVDSVGDRVLPDGESTVPGQLVMEGDYATRPSPDPELNGYSFGGYYESQDFVNPFSFGEIPIYDNTEIYVLWNEDEPEEDYYSVEIGFTDEDGNQVVDLENITLDGIDGEMTDNNTYRWNDFVGGTYSLHIDDSRFQTVDTTIEIYEDYTNDMMLMFNRGTLYLKFIDSNTGDTLTVDNLHIEESTRGYYYDYEEDSNRNYVFNDVILGNYNVIYDPPLDYDPGLDNIDVSQHPTTITISLYPVEEPDLYNVRIRFVNDDGDTIMTNVIPTLDGVSATYEGDIEYYVWYDVENGTHALIADFNQPFIGINQEIIVADSDYEEIIPLEVEEPEVYYSITYRDVDENGNYITDGGSVVANSSELEGSILERQAWTPGKDGYTFDDFYEDINGNTPFEFGNEIHSDETIYVRFIQNEEPEVEYSTVNITVQDENGIALECDNAYALDWNNSIVPYNDYNEQTCTYTWNQLSANDYNFYFSRDGYNDESVNVSCSDGSIDNLTVTMTPIEEPEEPELVNWYCSFSPDDGSTLVAVDEVTITNNETGQIYNGEDDGTHTYYFTNIPVGEYYVQATAEGYEPVGYNTNIDGMFGGDDTNIEPLVFTVSYVEVNTTDGSDISGETTPSSESVVYNGRAAEPEPYEKEGFTFMGFYEDNECTTEFDFSNTQIEEDKTIYVGFNPIKCYVSYENIDEDGNSLRSGDSIWDVTEYNYGDIITERDEYLGIDGYEFVGYFEDMECTIPFEFGNQIYEDITIYAKWTPEEPEPEEPEEPENNVDVVYHGIDINGNDMWNGDVTNTSYDYGETEASAEWHLEVERVHSVDGYHITGYFLDIECTQPFNFDEPIYESMDVYVLYEPDEEEEPIEENYNETHTLKVGINVEDDGVDEYVQVDRISMECPDKYINEEYGEWNEDGEDYDIPDFAIPVYDNETHQYVFSNVPNDTFILVFEKNGYARYESSPFTINSYDTEEISPEYTLSTTTTFTMEFDNDFGDSLEMDNVELYDLNDNKLDVEFECVTETTNGITTYIYQPLEPVSVGEYIVKAVKDGYEDVNSELTVDGWFFTTISASMINDGSVLQYNVRFMIDGGDEYIQPYFVELTDENNSEVNYTITNDGRNTYVFTELYIGETYTLKANYDEEDTYRPIYATGITFDGIVNAVYTFDKGSVEE